MILAPRRPFAAAAAVASAATLGAALLAVQPGAAAEKRGSDAPTSSPNITHLTNIPPSGAVGTNGTGTDIAFQGGHAFVGNYNGFSVYDISDPANTTLVSQVYCPGSQNDISVHGDILVLSTDSSRSNNTCSSTSQSASIKESWEGLKVFDVSDVSNPRYVAAVETHCGSHTHTLLPQGEDLYVYSSAFFPSATYPDCQPPHDLVDVVKIPIANPAGAALVASPTLFPDGGASSTSGCHDITVFPSKNLAAGACMGDGILFDVTDPVAPVVLARKTDPNFAFWHSATFNQNGTKVIFTDELGGGVGAECTRKTGPTHGADAIYDIGAGNTLTFRSYFKIPRLQTSKENCVAHNGSLIPAAGRDIMVQAWYQGGLSVVDFTDSANPQEIAYFDRPAYPGGGTAGFWSAYYYNGHIYGSEILRGFDVFRISDPRTDSAAAVVLDRLNVQTQPTYQ